MSIFEQRKAALEAREAGGGQTADAPWTVGDLAERVKSALTRGLPAKVRVVGEVSNLSDRNHWFFSLKDGGGGDGATVRAVMFASAARRVRFPVRDGQEVVATGRVDFYAAQGSVQLYVDQLEPVGEGAREAALRAMIEELREAGYFSAQRKRPLPAVPTRIAVVTSRSAAALQDVIHTAAQRWAGCELVLVDVRVQGESAAGQIAAALRALSRHGRSRGIDAILLTRGGGSIEDLWAFNERVVADAVFDCELPIVAAIGHETDTTVAELVADRRCATPTQAAMTLVPEEAVLREQLRQLADGMRRALHRRVEVGGHRLTAAARHPLFHDPARMVERAEARLSAARQRWSRALPDRLRDNRRRLQALERTLEAVGPRNVLRRGYSYTLDEKGALLRSVGSAVPGQQLVTVLADGRVRSIIEGESGIAATAPTSTSQKTAPNQDEGLPPAPKTRRRRKPRQPPTDTGPTLFG